MSRYLLLLVEDSEDDLAVTLRAIRNLDADVEVVIAFDGESGANALGLCGVAGNAIRPDLILLDLKMPKIGGLELLSMIRNDERTRDLPVVVFSSSSHEEDIAAAHEHQADYEVKPIDFTEYMDRVKSIVRERLTGLADAPRPTASSYPVC